MRAAVVAVTGAAIAAASIAPVLALAVTSVAASAGLCIFCCRAEPLLRASDVACSAGGAATSLSLL